MQAQLIVAGCAVLESGGQSAAANGLVDEHQAVMVHSILSVRAHVVPRGSLSLLFDYMVWLENAVYFEFAFFQSLTSLNRVCPLVHLFTSLEFLEVVFSTYITQEDPVRAEAQMLIPRVTGYIA